jgi:ubiquitin carboxyl-terminal hydrolase 10
MLVESLPPVLILHVKRFVYDSVSGIGKNGKEVVFGPELEIRNGMYSSCGPVAE